MTKDEDSLRRELINVIKWSIRHRGLQVNEIKAQIAEVVAALELADEVVTEAHLADCGIQ